MSHYSFNLVARCGDGVGAAVDDGRSGARPHGACSCLALRARLDDAGHARAGAHRLGRAASGRKRARRAIARRWAVRTRRTRRERTPGERDVRWPTCVLHERMSGVPPAVRSSGVNIRPL